jgi:hypothetical protein
MRIRHAWITLGSLPVIASWGCGGDLANPQLGLPPGRGQAMMAPDGMEAPGYSSASEVPAEYTLAEIRRADARVAWSGSTAVAYSSMEYLGNRGKQTLHLDVLHDYTTVASTSLVQTDGGLLPLWRTMGTPLQYAVPNDCGQLANLTVQYEAQVVVFVQTAFTEVGADYTTRSVRASQPDCPEPDPGSCVGSGGEYMTSLLAVPGRDAPVDGLLYDPYDPGASATPSGDCEGSGSGGGGGPGGEEKSLPEVCGDLGGKLYYDYGCIEQYDYASGTWYTIWCGSYAVCET